MRSSRFRLSFLRIIRFLGPVAVTAALLTVSPAFAAGQAAPGQSSTGQARTFRAARLTFAAGDVHVERANNKAEDPATLNMPLVEGTVISSGADGQAEIEFEDGSLVRLTPNTGVSLLNLSVDSSGIYQTRIAILGGLAYLELRAGTKYVYSVDAGGDVISPNENATVRVNFDEPPALIAVLDGSVHVASASGSNADANAGQTVRIDAASEGGVYMIKGAIAPESWDQWNEDRDQAAADEASSQTDARSKFAGDQGYGWSDLDANGTWYNVPGQGEVWQPEAAAPADADAGDASQGGFDPYGYGSWVWTPAGYSWASGYGWGWLPYRCGQWSYWDDFGWGWTPTPSCGFFGFGGYGYGGYGYGVNFGIVPPGYRRPHRPVPGPGPIHPIIHGRGGPAPVTPLHGFTGGGPTARTIAGRTVEPLQPIGGGYTVRGGSALGSALQRDFPIDKTTHTPAIGLVATHEPAAESSYARAAWQPANSVNRGSYPVVQRPAYVPRPAYNPPVQGGGRPAPVVRSAPAPRESAPAQHSSPAPASHSSSSSPAPHGK